MQQRVVDQAMVHGLLQTGAVFIGEIRRARIAQSGRYPLGPGWEPVGGHIHARTWRGVAGLLNS